MINDAKIKFHLSGDTNMDEIGTEPNLQSGPYRNIVSTIAKLNRHVGEFYLVLQITNKPAPMQIDSDSQVLSFLKLLTKREEQVYSLAINGATNKSIADQLYISVETVKCHRKRIIKKAGVRKIGDIKSLIIRQSKMLE